VHENIKEDESENNFFVVEQELVSEMCLMVQINKVRE
jgi:hypothetical protein